ncbi:MAG: 3'-5' exonuclease domain-containing protein 2 [Magnetococcales bacterium]|nr:3'-5' exonuclease domain-containing protein 2 [Magnetococcales bacterium]
MSKDQINSLPIRKWEGKITLINSDATVEESISRLQKEAVLGFDTETKPVFRKGVTHNPCILQLAGENEVTLFQLNRLKDFSPIAELLSDKRILKVGVGLANDIDQLQPVIPFKPGGFVDVGSMARHANIQSRGLRSMAARFFGFRISKRAQCSNWEAKNLKNFQLLYAATDAWVSREIYQIMKRNDLIV